MDDAGFRALVARATLAPSVHNVQGWRWALRDGAVLVGWSLGEMLAAGDPDGRDAGLSCGAAVEAAVLTLGRAEVADLWGEDDRRGLPGCRLAARIVRRGGEPDARAGWLDARFTHRGAFRAEGATRWAPEDAAVLTSEEDRAFAARLNDEASLRALRRGDVRRELLGWMRLRQGHPRAGIDGMDRGALRMGAPVAWAAGLALGPLWGALDAVGLSGAAVAEGATRGVVACFHRPEGESPVTTGRAYLRLWLEATERGWAGWPMAAVADDDAARAALTARIGLPAGRRLVQALRFGVPDRPAPRRARRPVDEVIL